MGVTILQRVFNKHASRHAENELRQNIEQPVKISSFSKNKDDLERFDGIITNRQTNYT